MRVGEAIGARRQVSEENGSRSSAGLWLWKSGNKMQRGTSLIFIERERQRDRGREKENCFDLLVTQRGG